MIEQKRRRGIILCALFFLLRNFKKSQKILTKFNFRVIIFVVIIVVIIF